MEDILNLLHIIPLFRDLSIEELNQIRDISIQHSYPKKTTIFIEGSDTEAIFFILSGLVKTFKTDENGHEQIVSFLKFGDMFPHTGFFMQSPYPATAESIVDTQLLAIPLPSFERVILHTATITMKVMRSLSEKIAELQAKLQGLTGQDVQDRGLSFLLQLAESYGTYKNNKVYINVPMTDQEFANVIGTTRETVNRLMNQLRKEKLLETNRNGFILLDYDALKKVSFAKK